MSARQEFQYKMGSKDDVVFALYEFAPVSPGNPGSNAWDETVGELIVDDFTMNQLSYTVDNVVGGNNGNVSQIIVAGRLGIFV